jgi:hypothetical protein
MDKTITRRSFIKFGAGLTVTLAAGATLASLAGCDGIKEVADSAILGQQNVIDDADHELDLSGYKPAGVDLKIVWQ